MNIALIAHDAKKKLMQNFCIAYRGILSKNELYATGTTGRSKRLRISMFTNTWPDTWAENSRLVRRLSIMKLIW